MIRKLLQLAIFLLIANAAYRIAPVSWCITTSSRMRSRSLFCLRRKQPMPN